MIRKLGIIGDLHGEDKRLARVLEWLHGQQVDALLCTGDIADGRGCINMSCKLLKQAQVSAVAGNHDRWLLEDRVRHLADAHTLDDVTDENLEFLQSLPRQRRLNTVAGSLMLCHGVGDNDLGKVWPGTARSAIKHSAELDALIAEGDYRFLINGHMHFRVLIDFPELLMINAGTLKGEYGGVCVADFGADQIQAFEVDDEKSPELVSEHQLSSHGRRVWSDTQAFDGTWQPVTLYA